MERGKGSTLSRAGREAGVGRPPHRRAAEAGAGFAGVGAGGRDRQRHAASEPSTLRIHASHGFAIEALIERLTLDGLRIETTYGSSTAAAGGAARRRLRRRRASTSPSVRCRTRRCPLLRAGWPTRTCTVIDVATRRQGLMVAAGNPKKIYERGGPGARRRALHQPAGRLGHALPARRAAARRRASTTARIAGFEQGEFTHAAVAAYVASGMADVGFGVETPARHFKLDFVPLARRALLPAVPHGADAHAGHRRRWWPRCASRRWWRR